MLNISGRASSGFQPIIGEITRCRLPFHKRHDRVLITDSPDGQCLGYLALISASPPKDRFFLPHMVGDIHPDQLARLKDGDIVHLSGDGETLVLWERDSRQNGLFLTRSCDCRCQMCPQPPQKHDPALTAAALRTMDLLRGKTVENICITGGEPTLQPDDFLNVLRRCCQEHPESRIDVLTNGKNLADPGFAKQVAALNNGRIVFCVSFHSDIASIHDKIVNCPGSGAETQAGIYNLARYGIPVEIRHVIMKRNYIRLSEFAEYIYRYFPFCIHYAFMSLEIHGLASKNLDSVYIDPYDYQDELRKAVLTLHRRGLNVSVYNTPLCLCHADIRCFSRKSISSWKNVLLEECSSCSVKDDCCGFFSTSSIPISRHISPFTGSDDNSLVQLNQIGD
jgi:His-Xaa-Ser system radical SAM maturase HxsC